MTISPLFSCALLSALVAFGVAKIAVPADGKGVESAFERVMRTNKLRCGYYNYAPVATKDPTTGKMSGLAIDIMDAIAKKTGLEVEWSEEITFGTWPAALQAGRFDAVCTPLWGDSSYSRVATLSRPLFYDVVVPLVRADETRFSTDAGELNKPEIRLAVQENNMTQEIARTLFPRAKELSLPANTDYGILLQNVIANKADVAFWSREGYILYEQKNPGKIKVLELDAPLKIIPCQLPVLQSEVQMRAFIDANVEDLLLSGAMDRLLRKWESAPGKVFLRAGLPFAFPPKD